MDQFKDDLKVLEIDEAKKATVTIREVIKAYIKKAFRVHPDTSGYESTADFQALSNAYERTLKHLVDQHKAKESDENDVEESADNEEETFIKENLDRFNFPKKNADSFTVVVENILADTWQECFENLFGKPFVNKNKSSGTEAGRVWKVEYEQGENKTELTIHFYNKPVKSKKSKFLIQGGNHAFKCLFVFNEMPKIYKMVRDMKPKNQNLKTEIQCGQCSVKYKSKKDLRIHFLTTHSKSGRLCYSPSVKRLGRTKTMRRVKERVISYTEEDEKLLDEDTSISDIEEIEEISVIEKTTKEPLSFRCLECDYTAMDKFQMEVHLKDFHKDISDENCISYMCIECGKVFELDESYQKHMQTHSEKEASNKKVTPNVTSDQPANKKATDNIIEEQPANKEEIPHVIEDQPIVNSITDENAKAQETDTAVIKFECNNCTYEANNASDLNEHIASSHLQGFNCPNGDCNFIAKTQLALKTHRDDTHPRPSNLKCNLCEFTGLNDIILKEHKLWTHKFNYTCEECDYNCPVRYDMAVHIEKAHRTKVKIYPCDQCDIVFGDKNELDKHFQNHKPAMDTSSGDEESTVITFLRTLAAQQELIITKLNKLETRMDSQCNDLRNNLTAKATITADASTNTENEDTITENCTKETGTKKKTKPLQKPASSSSTPSLISELPSSTPGTTMPSVPQPETPAPQKDQILIVGDSITHNANFRVAEIATNTTIKTAKAYAADYDLNTRKPNKNVRYVARNEARKKPFKFVLLHSPSVHILNLNTTNHNDESISKFKKVVEDSAKKMIETAAIIIKENPPLKKLSLLTVYPDSTQLQLTHMV